MIDTRSVLEAKTRAACDSLWQHGFTAGRLAALIDVRAALFGAQQYTWPSHMETAIERLEKKWLAEGEAPVPLTREGVSPEAQAEVDAFTEHLHGHRRTEAGVEGCRFCVERDVKRIQPDLPPPAGSPGTWAGAYDALYKRGRGE